MCLIELGFVFQNLSLVDFFYYVLLFKSMQGHLLNFFQKEGWVINTVFCGHLHVF